MDLNKTLKEEANILLNHGLYDLLKNYGEVLITGSYDLDLMVWRDLDLYVDVNNIKQEDVYEIMCQIFKQYKPVWAETKNTFNDDSGCPRGYFLGFETLFVNDELWNVDIWFTNKEYISLKNMEMDQIKSQLNKENKDIINHIKNHYCKHSLYGNQFFSIDIYDAVLNSGVKTVDGFKAWLLKKDVML